MKKAIFLDRDGTINVEKNYVYKFEEFEFIDGVPMAIKQMNDMDYLVIVITNQAGIARGYYTEQDMHKLHKHIDSELAKIGTKIDAYYYCPHHPVHGIGKYRVNCNCRKPNTGMLEEAIADYDIDVSQSYLFGDKPWDIECGVRLEIRSFQVDHKPLPEFIAKLKVNGFLS